MTNKNDIIFEAFQDYSSEQLLNIIQIRLDRWNSSPGHNNHVPTDLDYILAALRQLTARKSFGPNYESCLSQIIGIICLPYLSGIESTSNNADEASIIQFISTLMLLEPKIVGNRLLKNLETFLTHQIRNPSDSASSLQYNSLNASDLLSKPDSKPESRNVSDYEQRRVLKIVTSVVDSILSSTQSPEDLGLWNSKTNTRWISIATILLMNSQKVTRTIAGLHLLPALLRIGSQADIDFYWNTMKRIYNKLSSNVDVLDVLAGSLCRTFDTLMGLNPEMTSPPNILKDIRAESFTFELILKGLAEDGSILMKYCSYLLKKIVSFSDQYSPMETWKKEQLFWWPKQSSSVTKAWEDFFFLFDTLGEPSLHLIEPHLPKLFQFFEYCRDENEVKMNLSWWNVLLIRVLNNTAAAVHRRIVEKLVNQRERNVLKAWVVETSFFFDHLLPTLQDASLYEIPGRGEFRSPLGESVSEMIVSIISSLPGIATKSNFIKELIKSFPSFKTRLPLLFMLQGLSFYANHAISSEEPIYVIGDPEMKLLQSYLDDSAHAATLMRSKTAHQVFSGWTLQIIAAFLNPSTCSFRGFTKFFNILIPDAPIENEDQLEVFTDAIKWRFPEDWLKNEFKIAIRSYLLFDQSQDGVIDTDSDYSGRELALALGTFVGNGNVGDISLVIDIKERISRLKSPYLPAGAGLRTVRLVHSMLEFGFFDLWIRPALNKSEMQSIAAFLINEITYRPQDFKHAQEWLRILEYLIIYHSHLTGTREDVSTMIDFGFDVLLEGAGTDSLTEFVAMKLAMIAIRRYNNEMDPYRTDLESILDLLKHVKSMKFKKVINNSADAHANWNEIQSMYDETRHRLIGWINLDLYSKNGNVVHAASISSFSYSVDQLDNATAPTIDAIYDNLMNIIATESHLGVSLVKPALVSKAIAKGVDLLKGLWNNSKEFSTVLETFCYFCFHQFLLCRPEFLDPNESPLIPALSQMMEWSHSRVELMIQPCRFLHEFWLHSVTTQGLLCKFSTRSLIAMKSVFCDLITYGPMREKGIGNPKQDGLIALKAEQMKSNSDEVLRDAEGTAAIGFHTNEYMIRVYMNDILLRLRADNKSHKKFAFSVMQELLSRHSENVQSFGSRFVSSDGQKIRSRIWCSILILCSFVQKDQAEDIISKFLDAIELEQLTEVRTFIEWAVVRVLMKYPEHIELLWNRLKDANKKSYMTISFLMIVIHTVSTLPDSQLRAFIHRSITELLPWCSSHHFAIRLTAQFGLEKLYSYVMSHPSLQDSLDSILELSSVLSFYKFNPDSRRHLKKCYLKYFMGGGFDPVKDFNVEFIFCGAFDAMELPDEDKISSVAFLRLTPDAPDVYHVELGHTSRESTRDRLKQIIENEKAFDRAFEESMIQKKSESSPASKLPKFDPESSTDISQKKIVPWEGLIDMDLELVSGLDRQVQKKQSRLPLIVCASLISLVPNLGGLCRTCEIFNAELLVLNNIKVAEDPGFVATSVTSGGWMPLKEVKEDALESYLLEMKSQGYTLIGLEQANRSVPLQDFTFPRKSLLLLGKEREGIPVQLIALLDAIIEIPQFGLIRSLNVHVSGALLIWEYTKQQMLTSA